MTPVNLQNEIIHLQKIGKFSKFENKIFSNNFTNLSITLYRKIENF